MYRSHLPWKPIAILLFLSTLWGANIAVVKLALPDLAPLFMAAIRSLVASLCLFAWLRVKGIPLFPSHKVMLHGAVIGLLFGSEFALIYTGLQYTLASRLYVLVYLAPFFVALEAHLFIAGDRLNLWKSAGLILAFCGVVVLFAGEIGSFSLATVRGDILVLLASILWASTTVYLKKFLAFQARPLQTLFYQVFFSAPLLLALSIIWEDPLVKGFSWTAGFSLCYQSVVIAFLSYLTWFALVHRYPVSILHAFSFFTPVFGVFISGMLILGEPLTLSVLGALVLVSSGMVLVNYNPPGAAGETGKNSLTVPEKKGF